MDVIFSEAAGNAKSAAAAGLIGLSVDSIMPAFVPPADDNGAGVMRALMETGAHLFIDGILLTAFVNWMRRGGNALSTANIVVLTATFHASQKGLFKKLDWVFSYLKRFATGAVLSYGGSAISSAASTVSDSAAANSTSTGMLSVETTGHDQVHASSGTDPASEDLTF
jgi:hypothetical protein